MTRPDIRLYKIAYDVESRASVKPPYRLLDNSDGRPDWYELWPILQFLERTELEENVWYGFVSPKFPEKAGLTYSDIVCVISRNMNADIALFSYNWPSLAFWQNPWIAGEQWHPGLMQCTEDFLKSNGSNVDLKRIWTDLDTSVLSNYFVAKKAFWLEWSRLARSYFEYVEAGGPTLLDNLSTQHRGASGFQLKVFVQERLVNWVLLNSRFKVTRPNYTFGVGLSPFVHPPADSPTLRALLHGCHLSKKLARRTGVRAFTRLFVALQRITRRTRNRMKSASR